jgi:hypothetical protein
MGDVEKLHPWLFNFAIGLFLGIVAWYFFRSWWLLFVVPVMWAYVRVAWVRGRGTT